MAIKDQIVAPLKEIPFQESTIETIDYAMYNWLTTDMNLSTNTTKGFRKIPIIWASAERAFITKNSQDSRDINGSVQLPLIVLARTSTIKDPLKKGTFFANIPPIPDFKGGVVSIARRIQPKKTTEFGAMDAKRLNNQLYYPKKNNKVVYETISIPIPVYIEVTYEISIKTLYQQQMNDLIQPFMVFTGGIDYFTITHENHRYEAWIESDFTNDSNVASMGEEERKFESTITVKVLGHLIGKGKNQEQPKIVIRENAVEVKFPRERIITQDELEHKSNGQSLVGSANISGIKKI